MMERAMEPVFVNPKLPMMWHGGDYNPDQWLDYPEILKEDIRLMKLSKCNVFSVGIFAWAALEPEEGRYEFGWLDRVFDEFERNNLYIDLATPSGARPAWMAQRYPEVLRVTERGEKLRFGARHNHCLTSPLYREKVRQINTALAKRYAGRKPLVLWHLSNEYSGYCHCGLCMEAFRDFLKERYAGSLDKLNHAWWNSFWSHSYSDWSQINPPSPLGESHTHGLYLDWMRFTTRQTCSFIKNEAAPLREFTPDVPVTTNLMGNFYHLNYQELAKHLDIVSWDSYPQWHKPEGDFPTGQWTAMMHDLTRSLKPGRPFVLMESTPSMTNWQPVGKLKRPGMHKLSSLQAVAHGSDSVMYFQWRKGRGSSEKFHGAVVGHEGHENTRTFRDVASVGDALERLSPVAGSLVDAKLAIVADWENCWAVNSCCNALNKAHKDLWEFVQPYHAALYKLGAATDIISEDAPLSNYRLLIAPMMYMVKPGVAERLESFVNGGGTLVLTFWSGIVDESDLCFLGGFPGPLRKLAGIWAEEIDSLYDSDSNSFTMERGNKLGLKGSFKIKTYCEVIHTEGAEALATYDSDYYRGMPALTVNKSGKGRVYYLAANGGQDFIDAFVKRLVKDSDIEPATTAKLPEGVVATARSGANGDFLFVMNFSPEAKMVDFKEPCLCLESGRKVKGKMCIPGYGALCLKKV